MQWIKPLYHYVFPSFCLLCRSPSTLPICKDCNSDLPWQSQPIMSMPEAINKAIDTIICPFTYQPPIDFLIQKFKFNKQLAYGQSLAGYLQACILAQERPYPQALLPVPLHHKRLKERGFNQAIELAKPLAKTFNIPILSQSLKKIRYTPPQVSLSRAERLVNLKQAFQIVKTIPYQHIAIIDDVITTHTTVMTIAQLLKQAGVQYIEVWALAIGQPENQDKQQDK